MSEMTPEEEGARIAFLKKKKEERQEREAWLAYLALASDPKWNSTTLKRAQELKDMIKKNSTYKKAS